jgi:hypothetical protein
MRHRPASTPERLFFLLPLIGFGETRRFDCRIRCRAARRLSLAELFLHLFLAAIAVTNRESAGKT